MEHGHGNAVLEQMLEPVSRCFNPDAARSLLALRIDERTLARVEILADKCNEGQLTEQEQSEYEAYVQASNLVGILQAKARQLLAQGGAK
jgi:hypothetical protein